MGRRDADEDTEQAAGDACGENAGQRPTGAMGQHDQVHLFFRARELGLRKVLRDR